MEVFLAKCAELGANLGGRILGAAVVLIVGCLVIRWVKKAMVKAEKFSRLEKTVQSFTKNLVTVALYAVLIIAVIGILGIPMSSVIAVLASCGLAIGLALQGALGNFAGGLMVLIFKPFRVGDYIQASGAEGTVRDISIFYTTIITNDNKRITVPNGDLMNANVTNFSCEKLRRVDLDFRITNDCDINFAKSVLLKTAEQVTNVLADPAPFARMTAVDDDTLIVTVRVWCESAAYWTVYSDTLEACCAALAANGIEDPEERIAVRVVQGKA